MNKSRHLFFIACSFFIFFSCKTFGANRDSVTEKAPLNYSNEDVSANEIKRIRELLLSEPVEAFWRSFLLNDEKIIQECSDVLVTALEKAYEEKDYLTAWRYAKSIKEAGLNENGSLNEKYSFSEIENAFHNSVPGFAENSNEPKNISEAIKATVTVLVDKGLVIKNGAGYQDKVLGSGFFIDKRGYIVTNHHVIADMVDSTYEGYSRLYIKFPGNDDEKIPAKVIGWDPVVDLALLKTELEPEYVLSLGSSKELDVGDHINVIGAPLGLEGSLSSGIVSNTRRRLFTTGDVFQIDAPVNSGNSGGPCIDGNNKVQAIVFAGVMQAQGLNFAIPVEYLKQELPVLYAGGQFHHSWTGCYGQSKRINGKNRGVEILYVTPGTPACISGIKPGQVITEVNGISINSMEKFQSVLRDMTPGCLLNIKLLEDDNLADQTELEKIVYVAKRPEYPALEIYKSDIIENSFLPLFGMKLSPTASRNVYKIENVVESSNADEMQFAVNDPLTIRKIKPDDESEYILAQIVTRRHKKNFLDVSIVLGAPYDGPNYF